MGTANSTTPTGPDAAKRVLIYSHDTVGLGNIRRTLVIANHLVETRPDVTVLILSGSPMLHAFRIKPGIDYVKLPCLDRSEADGYRVKTLGVGFKDLIRLRASLIQHTMLDFEPDLILVDKKPLGVGRELAPAFELLGLRGHKPKCALMLRDILDHPAQTVRIWEEQRYHQALEAFYDSILILGREDVFDLAREYEFPHAVARKVQYCGYLPRPQGRRGARFVREQLGIGRELLVLVTVGGGEDGAPLLKGYLAALQEAGERARHHTLLLTGPELASVESNRVARIVGRLPRCHLGEFTDDIMSELAAADLVISMAGYNTVCEILSLGKPAIVVPRARPVREQLIRAERMSRMGLFEMIHPDQLEPTSLFNAIERKLGELHGRYSRVESIELTGMERLGRAIDALLPRAGTIAASSVAASA